MEAEEEVGGVIAMDSYLADNKFKLAYTVGC